MSIHAFPRPASSPPPSDDPARTEWPLRAWGLALLGGLTGFAIYLLTRPDATELPLALATFLGVGAVMLGILVERSRIGLSLGVAALCGAVVALTIYWNGPFGQNGQETPWRLVCALLSVVIAAPLFQAWRGQHGQAGGGQSRNGPALPYRDACHHGWTNVMLWCAAWIFVGITWLMLLLLGQLFKLIGISLLSDMLNREWAILILPGTAFGAGLGLLRDREPVLGLLQRVVTTVLAVLAPVMALGLVVFLMAIPFTGLTPLWEATKSTTPILLSCIIGALCLINAVIGGDDAHAAHHPVLRGSVVALSLAILPLAVIVILSTGSRIHQYGLTPDRLWAATFTAIACAYGLAYLIAIARGRASPAPYLRSTNLRLAIGLCALAVLLSTPLVNFGALATRDQMARIRSGATPADRIDWRALRFDFGKAGVAAVEELARQGATPAIRTAAAKALKAENRWALGEIPALRNQPPIDTARLTILPRKVALPGALLEKLTDYDACGPHGPCVVLYEPDGGEAIIVTNAQTRLWTKTGDAWISAANHDTATPAGPGPGAVDATLAGGRMEVRTITRRQVFVDGKPVNMPFE